MIRIFHKANTLEEAKQIYNDVLSEYPTQGWSTTMDAIIERDGHWIVSGWRGTHCD
jgi:hypothetical protein